MKYQLLILSALLLSQGKAFAADSYTIAGYLETVGQHSKDLKLAERDKEMAVYEKKSAVSEALPTIGLESAYTYNITDYYMYLDKSALAPGSSGYFKAPIKRDNEYSAAIAMRQTLYSPTIGNAIEAANQYQNLTEFAYEASVQSVLAGAKKLYYQCLLQQRVLEVTQAAETNAEDNYHDMQVKYDNGQVSQLDLLLAESRWRAAIPETMKAQRNLSLAMNALKDLAGIDLDRVIDLDGDLGSIPELPDMPAVSSVLDSRPDYQALTWQSRLLTTSMNAAKNAKKPTLMGSIAYAFSGQSNKFELAEENNLLFAGITLSMPIYTGGAIDAKVQKARVEVVKNELRMEKTKDAISIDLRNVHLRLREAHVRIASAESMMSTAERAFRIAETTAREGLITQLQLKDARFSFDQAALLYYAAMYEYRAAYFDWELTVGNAADLR